MELAFGSVCQRSEKAGALVGINRLGVGDKATDVVIQENTVSAEQLARPAHRLPRPDCAESFCQRGVLFEHRSRALQLGQGGRLTLLLQESHQIAVE